MEISLPQAGETALIVIGLVSGVVSIAVILRWYWQIYSDLRSLRSIQTTKSNNTFDALSNESSSPQQQPPQPPNDELDEEAFTTEPATASARHHHGNKETTGNRETQSISSLAVETGGEDSIRHLDVEDHLEAKTGQRKKDGHHHRHHYRLHGSPNKFKSRSSRNHHRSSGTSTGRANSKKACSSDFIPRDNGTNTTAVVAAAATSTSRMDARVLEDWKQQAAKSFNALKIVNNSSPNERAETAAAGAAAETNNNDEGRSEHACRLGIGPVVGAAGNGCYHPTTTTTTSTKKQGSFESSAEEAESGDGSSGGDCRLGIGPFWGCLAEI